MNAYDRYLHGIVTDDPAWIEPTEEQIDRAKELVQQDLKLMGEVLSESPKCGEYAGYLFGISSMFAAEFWNDPCVIKRIDEISRSEAVTKGEQP